MATWEEFAKAAPELADFGAERFRLAEVAYLWPRRVKTVRPACIQ